MRNKVLAAVAVVIAVSGSYLYMRTSPETMVPKSIQPKEDIVIGYVAAQTKNPVSNFGVAARQGFEVAVDEINAAGGIMGHRIKPAVFDDEGDKELSKKYVEQLVLQDNAAAIVGPANSGNALYWLDIPQDNEVLTISPIATATEITTKFAQRPRNYIFRVSSLDKDQIRMMIAWALKRTNNGKIAILYDTTPYGMQGEKDVTEVLARWGKAPAFVKSFEKGQPDTAYAELLKEAQAAGADAIYVYSLIDSSSAIARAAASIKDFKPLLLGTAANAIDLPALAGEAASKVFWSAVVVYETDQNGQALNEKVMARYGAYSPAITTTVNTYDIVYMIKAAIEKAGSLDKAAVRDAFEGLESLQGMTRSYDKPFSKDDHEGLSASDFTVGSWKDGQRVYLFDEYRDIEIR